MFCGYVRGVECGDVVVWRFIIIGRDRDRDFGVLAAAAAESQRNRHLFIHSVEGFFLRPAQFSVPRADPTPTIIGRNK